MKESMGRNFCVTKRPSVRITTPNPSLKRRGFSLISASVSSAPLLFKEGLGVVIRALNPTIKNPSIQHTLKEKSAGLRGS